MASRFWVGGTGTWDAATTTNWSSSSGGAGGASVPGPSDTVTLDGSSGGGTVTVNTTVNSTSITMGAFTGTLDFSANNNNVTLSTFSLTGSGTRTLNMGNGTWTITGTTGTVWTVSTGVNLTFNANSSTLVFTATTVFTRTFTMGAVLTYNTILVSANTSGGIFFFNGGQTITTLNVTAPNAIQIFATLNITNPLNWTGSSSGQIFLCPFSLGVQAIISIPSGSSTMTWTGIRDMDFIGGATFTATNSFDLGFNTGITITPPGAAGTGQFFSAGFF